MRPVFVIGRALVPLGVRQRPSHDLFHVPANGQCGGYEYLLRRPDAFECRPEVRSLELRWEVEDAVRVLPTQKAPTGQTGERKAK